MADKKPILLTGMMGCGKTKLGSMLALDLGVGFVDLDEVITAQISLSINEIFAQMGEPAFRRIEHELLRAQLTRGFGIISPGGGAFAQEMNRTLIKQYAVSVFLNVDSDVIWRRIKDKKNRPLLLTENPRARFDELFSIRAETYRMADITLNLPDDSKEENIKFIKLHLKDYLP